MATFDTVETVLASAVATSGTFAFGYNSGRTAGDYTGAYNHIMYALGKKRVAPNDFSVSFGASSITVTYLGSTTIPAGTTVRLQLDRPGVDTLYGSIGKVVLPANVQQAPLYYMNLGAPAASSSTNIAASQTVTGVGTAFALNGTIVVGGVAVLDVPRNVVAAWTNTAILTITGTDAEGNTVVEKSASSTSHTGKKAFKTVTSITTNATITGATVGTGVVIGLSRFVPDASWIVAEFVSGVALPRKAGRIIVPFEIEQTELLAPTAEELVAPCAGFLAGMSTTVQAAITTGGTLAVAVSGGTATAGLTQTIANSATKGTRQSTTPTTRHGADTVVAKGDRITITPASFATAGQVNGNLEFDASAAGQLDGTFVAGVATAASATTGDTRGTYSPSITPDGASQFGLLISMPNPEAVGVSQYTG